ncbi:uncharacterized protein KY384_009166 [Bacidia gigantensis]|uniref:uncharacterized protein n=1 Tax=Bacidia gigantensis TaxID=2732470 RepID=UPI001D049C4A|nr:uncharacterized protein KY384_009166 [Bacidia gigantensis]KAG8525522.1 hypothetical protein KY384_009166 [Bacidia gigantensis]
MMNAQEYIKVAQSLPPLLLRFFARYPPPSSVFSNGIRSTIVSTALNTSSSDPNSSQSKTSNLVGTSDLPYPNPFSQTRHPVTGKLHDPKFSLRRQADLVKLARAHGVGDLLPPTKKSPEVRLKRREEQGLRVRGTGVGQRVKGHKWERTMKNRLETRRQAMVKMPELVDQWKQVRILRLLLFNGIRTDM